MWSRAIGSRQKRLIGATVVHDRNGHVRGAVDYCQWANTHFQYLAARGAKLAAIMLRRACKLDPTSPLYGIAEPVIFIHDEFVCEVDEAAVDAHEQLERHLRLEQRILRCLQA